MKKEDLDKRLEKISEGNTPTEQVKLLKSELYAVNGQSEINNTNKKWWRAGFIVLAITLLAVLLCCKCEGDKKDEAIKGLHTDITNLVVKNFDLKRENDSLKTADKLKDEMIAKQFADYDEKFNNMSSVLGELRWEVIKLRKKVEKMEVEENLKPVALTTKMSNKRGKEITIVNAVMAPKSSKLPSSVTIECDPGNVPEYGNVSDTLRTNFSIEPEGEEADVNYYIKYLLERNFLSKTQTKMMVHSNGFSNESNGDYSDYMAVKVKPRDHNFSLHFRILKIDYERREKARKQNIWGKVARGFGFGVMTYLRHSDVEFAVTYNGIDPYEDGNPYQGKNLSDRRTAGIETGVEILGIASYLAGEGLDIASDVNYHKSYEVKNMQITFEQNYVPANEYHEYTKYPNWK